MSPSLSSPDKYSAFWPACRQEGLDPESIFVHTKIMKQRVTFLGTLFILFLFFLPPFAKAHAQAWFMNDPKSFGQMLDQSEQNSTMAKEPYDFSTQVNMVNTISCLIAGCSSNKQSSLHYSKSALAGVNNYITAMYTNPPANTYAFVRDVGQSLGFMPKQVYAQGVGFTGLTPLLGIWKAFRNIAYVLLAFVMIIIGFMVMFRKKIDPKTVVSVQNALPRIVVTLLLITFSYAIVGLLIDLMYVAILLAIAIIGNGIPGIDVAYLQSTYTSGGLIDLFRRVFKPIESLATPQTFAGTAGAIVSLFNPLIGEGFAAVTGFLTGGIEGMVTTMLSPLLIIILLLALLFSFIRIFFMLLSAYINVIMAVILGPLQILLGAIPGNNSFMSWLMNVIVNLLTFVITAVMLCIGGVINQRISSENMWVAPLLPGASADLTQAIIGLGIVMVIPSVVAGLKKTLKVQPAIPSGLGAVTQPITGVYGTATQALSQMFYMKQMGVGKLFKRNS